LPVSGCRRVPAPFAAQLLRGALLLLALSLRPGIEGMQRGLSGTQTVCALSHAASDTQTVCASSHAANDTLTVCASLLAPRLE